jgi:hypothetical protein
MAKRNADQMFEKFSPASGEASTDRASVPERTVDAEPMVAVGSTGIGISGSMVASTFYPASEPGAGRTLARRSRLWITQGRELENLRSIDDVVTGL